MPLYSSLRHCFRFEQELLDAFQESGMIAKVVDKQAEQDSTEAEMDNSDINR